MFLVIGDIMIDVIVDIGLNIDESIRHASIDVKNLKISMGGIGNIASALAFLGAETYLIGACGNDAFCTIYEQDLLDMGVKPILIRTPYPTGLVISLLDKDKNRTMLAHPGANEYITKDALEEALEKVNTYEIQYLFTHGYFLRNEQSKEAVFFAIEKLRKTNNIRVFFDIANHLLLKLKRELILHTIKLSDLVFLNDDEARALTNSIDIDRVIEKLTDYENKEFVLKLGKKGSMYIGKGKVIHQPSINVEVKDTTGAGDAFDAAFMYAYSKGLPIEKCLKFANWFAGKTIEKLGARSYPSSNDTHGYLATL